MTSPDLSPSPNSESGPGLVCSVVLSYNNFADTDECLRSLAAQDYQPQRTVLVDTGSSDGSLARLKSAWGEFVTVVENPDNLGVAAGYNVGIRLALEMGADYIATCNNDVVLDPGFISALVQAFDARPDAGVIAPLIMYFDRPDLVWSAGATMGRLFGCSVQRYATRRLDSLAGLVGASLPVDWLTTCATLFRASALDDTGLLDERLFFGHDDVDWCLRARQRGYRSLVLARPLARHKVSVTSGIRGSNVLGPRSAYTYGSGSVLVGAMHFSRLRAVPFLLGLFALRIPYNVMVMASGGGWRSIPAYLRGIRDGLSQHWTDFWHRDQNARSDAPGAKT